MIKHIMKESNFLRFMVPLLFIYSKVANYKFLQSCWPKYLDYFSNSLLINLLLLPLLSISMKKNHFKNTQLKEKIKIYFLS